MDTTWTRTPPRGCPSVRLSAPDDSRKVGHLVHMGRYKMFRVLSIHRDGSQRAGAVGVHHLAVENHGGAPNASSEFLRHVGGP